MTKPADGGPPEENPALSRSYYRVRARIALRYRPLAPGEFERVKRDIETPHQEPEDIEPALAGWLKRIESKLELLLHQIDPSLPRPLGPRDVVEVELSGSGMRFETGDDVEPDVDVLLEFELPGPVPRRVACIARVLRCTEPGEPGKNREVAVSFRVIDEDDRQAVLHFSHDVQRVFLRARVARSES